MPRCETCAGVIRTKRAMTHDQDPCFVISRMEFDADVGWPRGMKTYFCTRECAIEGLVEKNLLDPDDPAIYSMRQDHGPGEAEPDVVPLLKRAQELLVDAREQLDQGDDAWDYVQGAAAQAESAQTLIEGPEILEDDENTSMAGCDDGGV